jgi:CubicO group peptidase (beta-lactamase class C family)
LLARSYTDGFLVLHRGRLVSERYFNGMAADTPHLLMSVSKSIVGAVAGALAGRGLLDVGAQVTDIVPELGATFAGASVRDLLDMRAGTRFNEDYADLRSDVRTYEQVYLWRPPESAEAPPPPADAIGYFGTLSNDGPHGGPFRYRSILTDVLGWVLERAAGARLADLVTSEVWQPMGAEFDADVTVDARGNAFADGGISATLRDLARFGEVFLSGGRSGDGTRQVVPDWWIADTITGAPDGAQAFVDGDDAPGYPPGAHYRNCWWVREPAVPFFYASGINGQNVFVHVPAQLVVAKLSTWPTASNWPLFQQTLAAVLAIAATLASDD